MRPRNEILGGLRKLTDKTNQISNLTPFFEAAILEVLLDIRDLQVTANELGQRLLRASRKTHPAQPSDV